MSLHTEEPKKSDIDLDKLSPANLIGIVDNLAIRLNDELDGTTPENLIGEANREWRKNRPRIRFEVSRGNTGFNGDYRTPEEGYAALQRYAESFPNSDITFRIINL